MVDLPGYGFLNSRWPSDNIGHLHSFYLKTRQSLYGMVLIVDIRHPLTKLDLQMLDWFRQTKKPVHVLLTKAR
ncbi:MAG: hypothetical protein P0107_01575 [Nitrosomonas sp.]|nr:hypothetical protein [Nitrosomonas sp.]